MSDAPLLPLIVDPDDGVDRRTTRSWAVATSFSELLLTAFAIVIAFMLALIPSRYEGSGLSGGIPEAAFAAGFALLALSGLIVLVGGIATIVDPSLSRRTHRLVAAGAFAAGVVVWVVAAVATV
jgi:uncharacterized membrane protein